MVIDDTSIDQQNTVFILLQRRIERIIKTMNTFTDELKNCESLEDVKKLTLKINEVQI